MGLSRDRILYKWINIPSLHTPDLSPHRQTHTSLTQYSWGIHQAWFEKYMDLEDKEAGVPSAAYGMFESLLSSPSYTTATLTLFDSC